MMYRDRVLTCVACGGDFVWTAEEQRAAAVGGKPVPDLDLVCRAYCRDSAERRALPTARLTKRRWTASP